MDIVTNARGIAAPCLIQFGTKDPYLDASSTPAAEALSRRFSVSWLDDDHAMAGSETIAERWRFLQHAVDRGQRETR